MTRLVTAGIIGLSTVLASLGTSTSAASDYPPREATAQASPGAWVYQLQGYADGKLRKVAAAPGRFAVVDLARDANKDWFTRREIKRVRHSGKKVLAYFEIGSIETFRPEYPRIRDKAHDLILNQWPDWPDEYFVKYWDERWWDMVVRPRVDRALKAGFSGIYMDTPLAYEEIKLSLVPGATRRSLAKEMVGLIRRISKYAKAQRPRFLVVPQNSPELRHFKGYTKAIDGIGMEELFYLATDKPCTKSWCSENLDNTRALKQAGKFVLAVDYAKQPANIQKACAAYAREGFYGYVTTVDLNRITPACSH